MALHNTRNIGKGDHEALASTTSKYDQAPEPQNALFSLIFLRRVRLRLHSWNICCAFKELQS